MVVGEDQIQSEDGQKKAVASLLIVKAETIDEARNLIESDIYYTSGVVSYRTIRSFCYSHGSHVSLQWDSEKLLILPFIPATPFP
jgi:hypothetical protein